MTRAIDKVKHCHTMQDVRREVNALDDVLVPLLVERVGWHDPGRPHQAKTRPGARRSPHPGHCGCVREQTLTEGGDADVMEAIYRSLMEACIAYEHREFARLREPATAGAPHETLDGR